MGVVRPGESGSRWVAIIMWREHGSIHVWTFREDRSIGCAVVLWYGCDVVWAELPRVACTGYMHSWDMNAGLTMNGVVLVRAVHVLRMRWCRIMRRGRWCSQQWGWLWLSQRHFLSSQRLLRPVFVLVSLFTILMNWRLIVLRIVALILLLLLAVTLLLLWLLLKVLWLFHVLLLLLLRLLLLLLLQHSLLLLGWFYITLRLIRICSWLRRRRNRPSAFRPVVNFAVRLLQMTPHWNISNRNLNYMSWSSFY